MTATDGKHRCPWPQCSTRVPYEMWGCRLHWYRLPWSLRTQLWGAYRRPGPLSKEHAAAMAAIDDWLAANVGTRA